MFRWGMTQVHHLKIVLSRAASLEGRWGLNRSLETGVQVRLAPKRSCVHMNKELFLCIFKDSSLSSSHSQGFQPPLPMAGETILGHGSSVHNKGPLCSSESRTVTLVHEKKIQTFPIEHPDLQENATHFLKEVKKRWSIFQWLNIFYDNCSHKSSEYLLGFFGRHPLFSVLHTYSLT